MRRGRLNLYHPDYCEAVKAFPTITAFARHVGVAFQTVYVWTHKHPEFADAVKAMRRSLPTLYRVEYCDEVVDCLKDGHSLACFAGQIGVTPKSIYDWMAKHPEFADAVRCAQAKSILWWERRILDLAQNGKGNAKAIIFGLKNRAAQDWRDNIHTEASGKMAPARIECVIVDPRHGELSRY